MRPRREQVLRSIDRFSKRDPELHEELIRQAQGPEDEAFPIAQRAVEFVVPPGGRARAARLGERTRGLRPADSGYEGPHVGARAEEEVAAAGEGAPPGGEGPPPGVDDAAYLAYERRVAETIVRPSARPVLAVRDNRVTTEFLGPDSATWRRRIDAARTVLDAVIPAIGRVELKNNPDYAWVGTGWLLDDDVVVTNRHVASTFGRGGPDGFVFRLGVNGGPQAARIDFLEEIDRVASLEFSIESILWIAKPTDPDIAFLRVRRVTIDRRLARKIRLAERVVADDFVVTIGYPARDPRVPDQRLVQQIFGDVYDKKRLAPGQIVQVGPDELEHDCSTLGGNSGSPVINLHTGEAVGLHFAGLFMEANYAVPAPKVNDLLEKARRAELPGMGPIVINSPQAPPNTPPTPLANNGGVYTFQFQIPVEVTVKVGGVPLPAGMTGGPLGVVPPPGGAVSPESFDLAVYTARQALQGRPDVLEVRAGYRFRRGWITDERVIVVAVGNKMSPRELGAAGITPIPPQFMGIGVDVRTGALPTQLESLGVRMADLEAPPKPGAYREPPDLPLTPVKEAMRAVFHISPDSGFPNLRNFLERVKSDLTATMYEWEAEHISNAVESAISPAGRTLRMVTQMSGTRDAVEDMKSRLGGAGKFHHVWASVGSGKLITSAYHIKVASRDGEEFWLSSGNWKDSNQPNIDPAGDNSTDLKPLRDYNRDWHVVMASPTLAALFRDYIEWDFEEAERVPVEEGLEAPLPDLFVPEAAFAGGPELPLQPQYLDPLVVDRELEVHPLLTPDRNAQGRRMFLDAATRLVNRATRKVYVQNQSFSLLADNVDEFEQIFGALRDKQQAGLDVRIIFRDAREFSSANGPKQQELLERLKDFGLDTDFIKVQKRLHTKAIIVDASESNCPNGGEVLFGSHNLTNAGALFNRDASLLVKDAEVAAYFEKAFLYDWETLAVQQTDEVVGGMRIAGPDEETPPRFRRVSLAEFLGED